MTRVDGCASFLGNVMARRFVCLFNLLLVASGLAACTYDDGGIENQNGKDVPTDDDSVICSTKCPEGYFCDGKSKGCISLYDAGSACQDKAMCKSGVCSNNLCGCASNEDCPNGQTCEAGACVAAAGARGGDVCTLDKDCLTQNCNAGVCACNVTSDCLANYVCDAGTCRKAVVCPDNPGNKCFSALELVPPETSWNIGKLKAVGDDYAGSAYDLYLPRTNVVTCSYPITVRKVLFSIFANMPGLENAADTYCIEHAEECAMRTKPGCYLVELDKQVPFTFVAKENSKWTEHNFYVDFLVSESGIEKLIGTQNDENYVMYFTPQYNLDPGAHVNSLTDSKYKSEFFPGQSKKEVVVKYEVAKCTDNNFAYFQVANSVDEAKESGIEACKTSYQVVVESRTRSGGNVAIDSALKACTMDLPAFAASCNSLCSDNDGKLTYSYSADDYKAKAMMYKYANVSSPANCLVTDPDTGNSTWNTDNPECFAYGYPGPVSQEMSIWRSCRTGKIVVDKITVYVEVSDDEIAK